MDVLKRSSKPTIILLFTLVLVCLVLNINKDYENNCLFLVLNSFFLGMIPLAVSVFSARTYVRHGIASALHMSCGMLAFALGSTIAACTRFLSDSANFTVTTHNLSACLFSICNLAATMLDKPNKKLGLPWKRKLKLGLSFLGVGIFVMAVVLGAVKGVIPQFFDSRGSTEIRNVVLCATLAISLASSIAFYQQHRLRNIEYLYWYSFSMLLISLGLFAVFAQKVVGSPLGWMGRICQYVGCVYALISMAEVVRRAEQKGIPLSNAMTEFFIDAESNYKTLVEHLSSAVINVNEDSKVFFVNTAATRLFKHGDHDFLNVPFIDRMILEPHRTLLRNDAERFRTTGKSELVGKTLIMEAVDGEGRVFPVELSFSICVLSTGYAHSYIVRDIAERISREEKLTLQAEELQEKNKLITEFFTNISHEFKTPLTIIMNAIEISEMRLGSIEFEHKARVIKNLSVMRQNAHRLLRLIANLLDVTKIDAGFLQVNLTNINIKEWMRRLVDSVVDFAARREIEVTLVDELEVLSMPMDGEMLDRIMLNLISNAIKHTDKGGHIGITMQESIDRIVICVSDDGEGIPDDKKDLIFDRFRPVSTMMTRTSEGSGIGLALTKSLVELLHGSIRFESTLGEGSRFYVELPILEKSKRGSKPVMLGLKLSRKVEMEFSDIL